MYHGGFGKKKIVPKRMYSLSMTGKMGEECVFPMTFKDFYDEYCYLNT